MNNTELRKVAIVGANRIPFAKSNTAYHEQGNQQLLTAALKGLVERYNLQGKHIDEVVAGAVLKHSKDFNLARECVLDTGLATTTSAFDIQQACGTGLEAAILVANKIALGQIDVGIAGGTDTTSDAPIAVGRGMQRAMMDFNKARSKGDQLKAAMKLLNPKNLVPQIPANGEPRTGLSMGQHCELTTKRWNISREDQDALALASHQNLGKAYDEGFFNDLVTPFNGLERDNVLRADTTLEKLAKLGPVFDRENGTLTAANSSNLTDGASCVLLASEEWAKANDLPILAYLVKGQASAVEFRNEEEGLLMAPAYAVPKMLDAAGITLQDFDYYEIHEAFAAQVLATMAAWEDETFCREKLGRDKPLGAIDRSKLNVKGSSIATGHPFAATGGRVLGTLAKTLSEAGSGRGLISICAAGGQGVTAIVER